MFYLQKTYKQKRYLAEHKKLVHPNAPKDPKVPKPPKIFKCQHCNDIFKKKSTLDNHILSKHTQPVNDCNLSQLTKKITKNKTNFNFFY